MCVGQNLGQFMFAQFGLHVCLEGNCVCCRSVSCYRIDLTGSSVCVCVFDWIFRGRAAWWAAASHAGRMGGGTAPPRRPPGGPQKAPRRPPGGSQEAHRTPAGGHQEAPRRPPRSPGGPLEVPRRPQEGYQTYCKRKYLICPDYNFSS